MKDGTALINYDGARRSLALATKVDEAKSIRDKAAALQTYARQRKDFDMEAWTAKIKLRATRRIGEISRELEKAKNQYARINGDTSKADTLKRAGLTRLQASRCETVADIPDEEFETYIKAQTKKGRPVTVTEVLKAAAIKRRDRKREARRTANKKLVERAETLEDVIASGGAFSTFVIDPPWDWGDEGDVDQFGRGKPVYSTIPYEELLELPIKRLSDKNAHLYLWITNRSLPKGFPLLEAWGFRYVTCLTWCKPSIGMGNYFRGSTEHILFGVRGSLPLLRRDVGTWHMGERGKKHSEKPDHFFKLIESCSPGPYLELFGRKQRENWKVWGAEAAALKENTKNAIL